MFEGTRLYVRARAAETRQEERSRVLSVLQNFIGHEGWFISGSYANPNIPTRQISDVDVFFYDEECFNLAVAKIPTKPPIASMFNNRIPNTHITNETSCAVSLRLENIDFPVQFIKVNFGTPKEIFEGFDLNVCKWAILSNGKYTRHPDANGPLHVTKVNGATFTRFIKYIHKLQLYSSNNYLLKTLVDDYIEDDTIVVGYYEDDKPTTVNAQLMQVLTDTELVWDKSYLVNQARERAPELLI